MERKVPSLALREGPNVDANSRIYTHPTQRLSMSNG